jgi:hypothetical protein
VLRVQKLIYFVTGNWILYVHLGCQLNWKVNNCMVYQWAEEVNCKKNIALL